MASRRTKERTPQTTNVAPEFAANDPRRVKVLRRILVGLAMGAVVMGVVRIAMIVRDPAIPLLVAEHGADWICSDQPFELQTRASSDTGAAFQNSFAIDASPSSAMLSVRGFRLSQVTLDDHVILPPSESPESWKVPRTVDIAPHLTPGAHRLIVTVLNADGPPAALAYCDAIGLRSDATWECSVERRSWKAVRRAAAPQEPAITGEFPPAEQALLKSLWVLAPVFAVAAFCSWMLGSSNRTAKKLRWWPMPFCVCALVMLMNVALGINNIWKLPAYVGFDVDAHLAYILFIMHNHALPLATDGWQMFQAPLYYMISLPIAEWAIHSHSLDEIRQLLRIVPLLCGAAQPLMCYFAARMIFPDRRYLQTCAVAVGGLMPMNLYLSQYIGNEALCGVLTAAAICLALAYAYGSARCRSNWWAVLLGGVLGAALLTKVTAVLLLPIVLSWMVMMHWLRSGRLAIGLRHAGLVVLMTLIVAGWYYYRNQVELGKPFIGGWDPSRKIAWWQDPGYRTPGHLLRWGASVRHPVYASVSGFWDSIYSTLWTDGSLSSMAFFSKRPPWNYSFVLGASLLGLIPCAALMLGAVTSCTDRQARRRGGLILSTVCVLIYLAAMADLFLKVPIFSTAKSTYMIGLLPCFGVLIAAGFEVLARRPSVQAILIGLIAAWAVNAYVGYFVH